MRLQRGMLTLHDLNMRSKHVSTMPSATSTNSTLRNHPEAKVFRGRSLNRSWGLSHTEIDQVFQIKSRVFVFARKLSGVR